MNIPNAEKTSTTRESQGEICKANHFMMDTGGSKPSITDALKSLTGVDLHFWTDPDKTLLVDVES